MPSRFAGIVLVTLVPGIVGAQANTDRSAFVSSTRMAVAVRNLEPLCDGTEIRRVEIQRDAGRVLMLTGAAVALLGALAVQAHPGRGVAVVLAAGGLGLGGAVLAGTAYPSESFWQVTLARAQRGITTSDDVRTCLHDPSGISAAAAEQEWTYRARPNGIFRWGHSESTVRFTFDNDVLKEVRRTRGQVDARQPVSLGAPQLLDQYSHARTIFP